MKPKNGASMKPKSALRFNAYALIARAVEEGVAYGYRRAYKYTEAPTEEVFREALENAVLGALADVLEFDHGGDDAG